MKYITLILDQMGGVSKVQKKFLQTLFSTIFILRGKMTFTNMSRYSELSEKTFRRHFRERFEFVQFNRSVIEEAIPKTATKIAVMDASFVEKSGKKTYGIDYFFNGCASRAEKGLEISAISIIDVETNTGYSLSVKQTPAQSKTDREPTKAKDEPAQKASVSNRKRVVRKAVSASNKKQPLDAKKKSGLRGKKKSSKRNQSKDQSKAEDTRIDFYVAILRTIFRREIKPLDGIAMYYMNKTKVSLWADFEEIQRQKAKLLSRLASYS